MITKKRMRRIFRIVTAPFAWGFITAMQEMGRVGSVSRSMAALVIMMFSFISSLSYFSMAAEFASYSIYAKILFSIIGIQVVFAATWGVFILIVRAQEKFEAWWEKVPEDVVKIEQSKKKKRVSREYTAMSDNPDLPVVILDEEAYYNATNMKSGK